MSESAFTESLCHPVSTTDHFPSYARCSYWSLYFDTSPRTLRSLNGIMRRDPRVLRWTVLKLADKVEDIAKEGERLATGSNRAEDIVP